MLEVSLAGLHFLALALGPMAVVLRGSALRDPLTQAGLKQALRLDNLWGVALALWIFTGQWQLFAGLEKPTAYYTSNTLFVAKMACLALVLALEVWPKVALLRTRLALHRGNDALPVVAPAARGIALIGHVQATLLVVMICLAAAMARGHGAATAP